MLDGTKSGHVRALIVERSGLSLLKIYPPLSDEELLDQTVLISEGADLFSRSFGVLGVFGAEDKLDEWTDNNIPRIVHVVQSVFGCVSPSLSPSTSVSSASPAIATSSSSSFSSSSSSSSPARSSPSYPSIPSSAFYMSRSASASSTQSYNHSAPAFACPTSGVTGLAGDESENELEVASFVEEVVESQGESEGRNSLESEASRPSTPPSSGFEGPLAALQKYEDTTLGSGVILPPSLSLPLTGPSPPFPSVSAVVSSSAVTPHGITFRSILEKEPARRNLAARDSSSASRSAPSPAFAPGIGATTSSTTSSSVLASDALALSDGASRKRKRATTSTHLGTSPSRNSLFPSHTRSISPKILEDDASESEALSSSPSPSKRPKGSAPHSKRELASATGAHTTLTWWVCRLVAGDGVYVPMPPLASGKSGIAGKSWDEYVMDWDGMRAHWESLSGRPFGMFYSFIFRSRLVARN